MVKVSMTIHLNHSFLDTIGPEQAWLIGLLAADGCIINDKRLCVAQSGDHGLALINYCQQLLEHTGHISTTQPKLGAASHYLYLPSPNLVEKLAIFGVIPKKTLSYEFPTNLPSELASPFIRGYIDGDGCVGVYKNGGSARYLKLGLFGNKGFIETLNSKVPVKGKTSPQSNGMQIWWNGSKAREFGRWVFADPTLFKSKKYSIFWQEEPLQSEFRSKYTPLKEEAQILLKAGTPPMEVANKLNIPFQTVYKWRAKLV
jgi:hypothetical protein